MKVGDLVKHFLTDEQAIVTQLIPSASGRPDGMVAVEWMGEKTHRNDWLYRASEFEIISENR